MSVVATRQLDDIIECPICLDFYDDPRILPCGHSSCLACLEQLGKNADLRSRSASSSGGDRHGNDDLACPICRKQFNVARCSPGSSRRFSDLPKNISVVKLLLLVTQSGDGADLPYRKRLPCDACSLSTNIKVSLGRKRQELAVFYCSDCHRRLCNACHSGHSLDTLTALHKTALLYGRRRLREASAAPNQSEKQPSSRTSSTISLSSGCSRHVSDKVDDAGTAIQLYCQDCREALCMICFIEGGHSAHRCVHVKDAVGKLRTQLVAGADALTSAASSCHRYLEVLNDARDNFTVDADRITNLIRSRADQLIEAINHAAEELVGRVETMRSKKLSRYEQARNTIDDKEKKINSLLIDVKTVVDNGIASDIVRHADELHDETSKCIKVSLNAIDDELTMFKSNITFNESKKQNFNAVTFFGSVDVIDECDATHLRRPKLTQSIPNAGGGVYAMTLLGNRLFVIRHGAVQVDVYDAASLPLTLNGFIRIPDLGTACYGLAASRGTGQYLYVSDYNSNLVHQVNLVDVSVFSENENNDVDDSLMVLTEPRSWTVGTQPAGLSTTESGSVLVTCYGAGEIQEYCRESRIGHHHHKALVSMTMVRVIRLQPDVTYPWHAVCISTDAGLDDHYVVTVSGTDHGVCVVNADGMVDRKLVSSNADNESMRMKSPRCLQVICEGGSQSKTGATLVIADQCNNRILLVDRSLSNARQLPIGDSDLTGRETGGHGALQLPGGLCVDKARDRLYVGEWIGGRVLVYDGISDYIESFW